MRKMLIISLLTLSSLPSLSATPSGVLDSDLFYIDTSEYYKIGETKSIPIPRVMCDTQKDCSILLKGNDKKWLLLQIPHDSEISSKSTISLVSGEGVIAKNIQKESLDKLSTMKSDDYTDPIVALFHENFIDTKNLKYSFDEVDKTQNRLKTEHALYTKNRNKNGLFVYSITKKPQIEVDIITENNFNIDLKTSSLVRRKIADSKELNNILRFDAVPAKERTDADLKKKVKEQLENLLVSVKVNNSDYLIELPGVGYGIFSVKENRFKNSYRMDIPDHRSSYQECGCGEDPEDMSILHTTNSITAIGIDKKALIIKVTGESDYDETYAVNKEGQFVLISRKVYQSIEGDSKDAKFLIKELVKVKVTPS